MKNFKSLVLSLVGLMAILTFTSCGEDDPVTADLPSVTVSATVDGSALADGGNVIAGSTISLTINVTAPGGINGLDVNGTSYNRSELGAEAGDTSGSLSLISETTLADVGNTGTVTIRAVDDLDQTTTVTFTYEIIAPPSPDARSYSAELLMAPTGDFGNKNFFSVSSGLTYSRNDVNGTTDPVSETIDFGYYYGSTEEASIASPKGFESTIFADQVSGWGTLNETVLKTTSLSAAQFTETTTWADIDDAFDGGTTDDNGIITGLTVGTVLAFETADGVKGLIHVSAIEPGFESDDSITLDIIAQLEAN